VHVARSDAVVADRGPGTESTGIFTGSHTFAGSYACTGTTAKADDPERYPSSWGAAANT